MNCCQSEQTGLIGGGGMDTNKLSADTKQLCFNIFPIVIIS